MRPLFRCLFWLRLGAPGKMTYDLTWPTHQEEAHTMPGLQTVENSVAELEEFIKVGGGAPKEWYVGISPDAASRLEQHGIQNSRRAHWIPCADENSARAIEARLLQQGLQQDRESGAPKAPPTQGDLAARSAAS